MKATLGTIDLIRDLTTTTIKIAKQDKFDMTQIMNYGPYLSPIQNIKQTVKEIPGEFENLNSDNTKLIACALIDAFFIIRDQIRSQSDTLQNTSTVLQ